MTNNAGADDDDPLYDDALKIVREHNRPSISTVQRYLKIGYNRAARLLEEMERKGVVSPMDADGTRKLRLDLQRELTKLDSARVVAIPTGQPCCGEYETCLRPCTPRGEQLAYRKMDVKPGVACHGLDTPERVCFYEQDFYVLSNFSAFKVEWKGLVFDTSEAAYHWEKFPGKPGLRADIMDAASAHEAFKLAEAHKDWRRPDWDAVKVDIMRRILAAKVSQHEYVRRKLLATGERELVENSWRDPFWGWGPNRDGKNMLGRLWMEVRAELRAGGASPVHQHGEKT